MYNSKNFSKLSKKSSANNCKQTTCKLFVGNLATHTTSINLQSIFHTYGQIIECVKVRERYGFVRFSTNDEAERALNACNGLQLNGYPMIVEYAQNEILISPKSPSVSSSSRYNTKKSSNTDEIPILKYSSSTLNPDASTFTFPCSTSDYYSQSDRPSSCSSSDRSNCLSPTTILPISYSDNDTDENNNENFYPKHLKDKQQSLNVFIGDKILNLYRSNVDVNNNNTQTTTVFDGRDIDPRDPIFIWNFAFYPDVSISPFIKRSDVKTLLERRVLLYS